MFNREIHIFEVSSIGLVSFVLAFFLYSFRFCELSHIPAGLHPRWKRVVNLSCYRWDQISCPLLVYSSVFCFDRKYFSFLIDVTWQTVGDFLFHCKAHLSKGLNLKASFSMSISAILLLYDNWYVFILTKLRFPTYLVGWCGSIIYFRGSEQCNNGLHSWLCSAIRFIFQCSFQKVSAVCGRINLQLTWVYLLV